MLPAMLLSVVLNAGLEEISGYGSSYVISILGSSSDPVCLESNSLELGLDDLTAGIDDEALCILNPIGATSFAETGIELGDDGFTASINGWGQAIGDEKSSAFSRHDLYASVELQTAEDLRVHVSWFVLTAGLGTVNIQVNRIGDIGGPQDPSPPIIDRGASSYIDPINLNGWDVLYMPAGRWRVFMYSTHQAMDTDPGFMNGFARTTHIATYVALGDVDGSGTVDISDLLNVIELWGPCQQCQADLDADGVVGVLDLLRVLADWNS